MFIPWTEIELFHNVRRTFTTINVPGDHVVRYRGKVKLHGTNAAIQCLPDGSIETQSRQRILSVENDNDGFARWVSERSWNISRSVILFGEWCGPGIMSGVAVNKIPKKIFAIFAALDLVIPQLITDPDELITLFSPMDGVYVLPWHGPEFQVDWKADPEALDPVVKEVNTMVEGVEECDPWVKSTFGVGGTGEGLVFYPRSGYTVEETYIRMFKAKGEKHRVVKAKVAAQVDPEAVKNLQAFVELVCPLARMEQGAKAVAPDGFETKRIGAFLGWIAKDVEKETKAELEASGLDPKAVQRALQEHARKWYLAQIAKL